MHPQLAGIVGDLQSAQQRLGSLRSTLTCDAWGRRPDARQWSPAECLAHLNLTSQALVPLLRAGLAQAGVRRDASPYRRDTVGWLISTLVTPSGGFRTRTHSAFEPTAERPVETLIAEFERLQDEIVSCVRAADGLAIDRVTIASPFARVRYNLYAALTVVPRHQHRHLLQAERAAQAVLPVASPLAV